MDSGLYVILAIVIPIVRIGLYMARQKETNQRAAGFAHADDDDDNDRELERVIREKEGSGASSEDQGDAGPYRARGARRPRRAPSTGPVVDEIVARCKRCDMRVSPGEEICASCARVAARRRRPK